MYNTYVWQPHLSPTVSHPHLRLGCTMMAGAYPPGGGISTSGMAPGMTLPCTAAVLARAMAAAVAARSLWVRGRLLERRRERVWGGCIWWEKWKALLSNRITSMEILEGGLLNPLVLERKLCRASI